jgi:hypothetical protein
MPSRAEIQCECAFTHMNARSRQNLSDAATAQMNRERGGRRKGGALDSVIGIALSRRTIMTCMWGVSDPRRVGRGAKMGAAKWGSLTPGLSLCAAVTAARTATPAAQSAAGTWCQVADWQEHRGSYFLEKGKHAAHAESERRIGRGTVLPSFGSPTLFSASHVHRRATRGEGAYLTLRPMDATANRPSAGEAAL